jgi:hypothetical protein
VSWEDIKKEWDERPYKRSKRGDENIQNLQLRNLELTHYIPKPLSVGQKRNYDETEKVGSRVPQGAQ